MLSKNILLFIEKNANDSKYTLGHLYRNNKDVFTINETAAIIINSCNGRNTLNDICNIISDNYEIEERNLLKKEIEFFLEKLIDLDIIVESEDCL